ncbi:M20/M25/M40 family metallo-hydrolase [Alicyclobacillaceae bacterium I2511]|nr:M20/M25/M40 family metallo-hydrolase [Alicyclobacillaceae bacterium I2511]
MISPRVKETYDRLLNNFSVQETLEFIRGDNANTTEDQIKITEIPAPSFMEQQRGQYYKGRLRDLGLREVQIDAEGNVFAIRKGIGRGPTVFVSAHLDTVFPEGTSTTVNKIGERFYAPGISDDGRGLAVILALLRAFNEAKIETEGDIIFGATVGEEGLGDLRGAKAFFRAHPNMDGFISIEPGEPTRTTYLATGSHRYKVTYKGPGGHSFGEFGIPSAIHAVCRAVAMIADLEVPEYPKTTFTVGEIKGGTSVNTIAAEATMMIDLRSNSEVELRVLEQQVLARVEQAARQENARWKKNSLQVQIELVGNRPAGTQPADVRIVQAALASSQALGYVPELNEAQSTDSNVPISLGIPAITLGGGGAFGGTHTLDEFFEPTGAYCAVQRIFLTVLGLVGLHNATEPLLAHHAEM